MTALGAAYRAVVLDLDGVVYLRDQVVPAAPAAVAGLRALGVRVGFLTNNSYRPPAGAVDKLAGLGIEAAPAEVVTSAQAVVHLLGGQARLDGVKALVVGGPGLREALAGAGAVLLEPDDWRAAAVVVVGIDPHLTYRSLSAASLAVAAGARFVGSNPDVSFPTPEGPWPGAGALLALVQAATGVRPEVAGKPEPALFEAVAAALGDGPYLMVGDRADTDLVGASRLGWDTALVLTGVTATTGLPDLPIAPDQLLRDVGGLLDPPGPELRAAGAGERAAVAGLLGGGSRAVTAVCAVTGDEVVGAVAWERHGQQALLLGPVVRPDRRGRLTGTRLVVAACLRLRADGVGRVAARAPAAAEGFLARLGFTRADGVPPAGDAVGGDVPLVRPLPPLGGQHAPVSGSRGTAARSGGAAHPGRAPA